MSHIDYLRGKKDAHVGSGSTDLVFGIMYYGISWLLGTNRINISPEVLGQGADVVAGWAMILLAINSGLDAAKHFWIAGRVNKKMKDSKAEKQNQID